MDSVVNLHKPPGMSSHQAVTAVRRLVNARKAGHAGTLDPRAEGVLLVCIGEATKISPYLSALDKEYLATIKLGERTDTCDAEGTVIETGDVTGITLERISEVVSRFVGEIDQVPPMYSAIKSQGIPLYKRARRGEVIERKPRPVRIYSITIINYTSPFIEILVNCSKGTYIRSLADDIGQRVGSGAHLFRLVRTRVGRFSIGDAASFDPHEIHRRAISIDDALDSMGEIVLAHESFLRARNGVAIPVSHDTVLCVKSVTDAEKDPFYRLKSSEDQLFGIGKIEAGQIRLVRGLLTNPKEEF